MKKEKATLYLSGEIRNRIKNALDSGKFPGVTSLSGMTELALDNLLKTGGC